MGSKANPAVIGAFVVGAIALAIAGVVVFGSGQFFTQTTRVVAFFSADVSGLNVGAPVRFKGVQIGTVKDIRLRLPGEQRGIDAQVIARGIRIPVVMQIDNQKLSEEGGGPLDRARLKHLIDLGLRAQLVSESLVTGLLAVQLNFLPDTPQTYVMPPDSSPPEIPTVPTSLEQLQSTAQAIVAKLEEIHFDRLVKSATEALDAVKQVAQAPGLHSAIDDLPKVVANVNEAVVALRTLTQQIDKQEGPVFESLVRASEKAGATMEQAQSALVTFKTLVDPNAPAAVELTASLRDIGAAARSLKLLTDYLERHPSALVRGRYVEDEK
jgi:paraquat-inducible protein B